MPIPAYVLKAFGGDTKKIEHSSSKAKFDKSGATIQTLQNEFFHNKVGNKLTKLAHENKDYPPQYLGTPLYLEFYLRGKCQCGQKYHNSATHIFIKAASFRALMDWSRSILQKYESKPPNPTKHNIPAISKKSE